MSELSKSGAESGVLPVAAGTRLGEVVFTARNVSVHTPPCFLAHAEDDPTVKVENSLQFRASCKAAGVPVETHLFTSGGHGFGLRRAISKPAEAWPDLFLAWARTQGLG